MAKPNKIKDNLEMYEQVYFTHDEPVPLKGHLKVYPVLVKDYNLFYSCIDIFTINKNEDPNGITMSNLDYFIYLMQPEQPNSEMFTRKAINMFELIFHIKNGIKCECDKDNDTYISYEDIYKFIAEKEQNAQGELSNEDIMKYFYEIKKCPKCGKIRDDLIKFNDLPNGKKDLIVDGVEIDKTTFDELRTLVCYYNMPDYDDEYVDPELEAELQEAARLENPNATSPSLEKQESCLVASTSYKYSELKELSIRKLVLLLRTVDKKLHYFTYRQAEASGRKTTMPLYIVICIENLFNCWKNLNIIKLQHNHEIWINVNATKVEKIDYLIHGQILNIVSNREPATKFRIGKRSTINRDECSGVGEIRNGRHLILYKMKI